MEDELRFDNNFTKIYYQCYFCKDDHHWYKCHNTFPNFAKVTLLNHPQKESKRLAEVRFNAWKNKEPMQVLERLNVDTTDVILRKIEEKVYAMKKEKD